jgi:hypothetical protein
MRKGRSAGAAATTSFRNEVLVLTGNNNDQPIADKL